MVSLSSEGGDDDDVVDDDDDDIYDDNNDIVSAAAEVCAPCTTAERQNDAFLNIYLTRAAR